MYNKTPYVNMCMVAIMSLLWYYITLYCENFIETNFAKSINFATGDKNFVVKLLSDPLTPR